MSAQAVLRELEALGCRVRVDGNRLMLSGSAVPPEVLMARVRQHKQDLLALLRTPQAWDADDWRTFFDERAGIAEFDAGMTRAEAERQAFEHCIARWLAANAPALAPGTLCVHCKVETADTDLALVTGAWVHARCHESFLRARRSEATAALNAFGVLDRSTSRAA